MKVVLLTLPSSKQVDLLETLRDIFYGRKVDKRLHVTIRGPFSSYPEKESLRPVLGMAEDRKLLIAGANMFEGKNSSVVYLCTQGSWLREVWLKPDYPISKFGFNPHITMYEGNDRDRALKILRFLRRENIELLVEKLSVSVSTLKQGDMFEEHLTNDLSTLVRGRLSNRTIEEALKIFSSPDIDGSNTNSRVNFESQPKLSLSFRG